MSEIIKLWVELIQNGIKTVEQTPKKLRKDVEKILKETKNKE